MPAWPDGARRRPGAGQTAGDGAHINGRRPPLQDEPLVVTSVVDSGVGDEQALPAAPPLVLLSLAVRAHRQSPGCCRFVSLRGFQVWLQLRYLSWCQFLHELPSDTALAGHRSLGCSSMLGGSSLRVEMDHELALDVEQLYHRWLLSTAVGVEGAPRAAETELHESENVWLDPTRDRSHSRLVGIRSTTQMERLFSTRQN